MKHIFVFICMISSSLSLTFGQTYTTITDTFYVPTPEYSASLGLDSLFFPCAITKPDLGTDFPILILVHGTAPLDRDAHSTKDYLDSIGATYRKAQTKMFYEIADSLSRNGIMVLRYDKRSYTLNCIEKPECWYVDTISPYHYIKDIHHAVDFAKSLPNVDTCDIFLAGHSQGGSFVSLLGYVRPDIRGVLNMAGTAQPIDSVAIYQEEFVNGNPAGAEILRQQFDALRAGIWPMSDTLFNQHFSPRFWLDWLSHTDSAVIVQKDSDKATALMYGSMDKFVPSDIHYQIWLDSVSRPNATFQLFENLDHSFGTIYDSTMSPMVLDFMQTWIQSNLSSDCDPTDIKEIAKAQNIRCYPNPTSHFLRIQSNVDRNIPYQLTDKLGKKITEGIIVGQQIIEIDMRPFNNGMYFLWTEQLSTKIIKR